MRKYIITLLFFMGICTFSLFKSEQIQNNRIEVEALVTTTTQMTSTTTTTSITSTTQNTTTTTTSETTTTTTTETTTTTTTTLPPETEPVTECETEPVIEETYEEPAPEEFTEEYTESTEEYVEEETQEAQPDTQNMRLLGNMKITGYVATGRPTASGVMPYVGGVAMSKSYGLPFGTQIYIEGLGYYTVNDSGCKYGVVDVFCSSLSECYNLTSYMNVYVVE